MMGSDGGSVAGSQFSQSSAGGGGLGGGWGSDAGSVAGGRGAEAAPHVYAGLDAAVGALGAPAVAAQTMIWGTPIVLQESMEAFRAFIVGYVPPDAAEEAIEGLDTIEEPLYMRRE